MQDWLIVFAVFLIGGYICFKRPNWIQFLLLLLFVYWWTKGSEGVSDSGAFLVLLWVVWKAYETGRMHGKDASSGGKNQDF